MENVYNVAVVNHHLQPQRHRGQQQRLVIHDDVDDKDDADLDEIGAKMAIIPPPLAPGAKINIRSTMFQLLNVKGLF